MAVGPFARSVPTHGSGLRGHQAVEVFRNRDSIVRHWLCRRRIYGWIRALAAPAAHAQPPGRHFSTSGCSWALSGAIIALAVARVSLADPPDVVRDLQKAAVEQGTADWGHWGLFPNVYSAWMKHSNRLIPIYTYGIDLKDFTGPKSLYRNERAIGALYGRLPLGTVNPTADYCDQTDVYRLQQLAVERGKKYVVLFIFDGTDWHSTRAAAIVAANKVAYSEGRGTGLKIQDYRHPDAPTDFGYFVTSPHNDGTKWNVDKQSISNVGGKTPGGYDWRKAGVTPWATPDEPDYLLGISVPDPQAVTDSAASATSMTAGVKTYNDAVNVDAEGREVAPIARQLQERGWSIGVVTSVPISHATPAAAYADNVYRDDYQDLTRDLLGLRSIAHPGRSLPGVDVLLGAGWGEKREKFPEEGANFVPGNPYITDADLAAIDVRHGGLYVVAQRKHGVAGAAAILKAADEAVAGGKLLFGFYGVASGHLPYRTADGRYDPTVSPPLIKASIRGNVLPIPGLTQGTAEHYTPADIAENPTLADMTRAALTVLGKNPKGFWLMVEAGDADWANHQDNIDNAIGAVLSGDQAFGVITDWMEVHHAWEDAAVIVTADHGHYFMLERPEALLTPSKQEVTP
jgi:alkaline phosphatase